MTDLPTLADRVAQAEGEYAGLFREAFRACFPRPDGSDMTAFTAWNSRLCRFDTLLAARAWIDLAMSLVPEGWAPSVMRLHCGGGKADAHRSGYGDMIYADGNTPALAVCCVALRARHASGAGEG